MKQAYRILPVYTGDVSGVCSALFELGGMVVIHDPSGCNSTYNTHDEIRWYDQDSLIFISGVTDVDAIMGNDEKLAQDVIEAVRQTNPHFVVLVNSPIPYQLGCDFAAIARMVQDATGVPTRYLATNGMHDYVRGAGIAFEALAEFAVKPRGDNARQQAGSGGGAATDGSAGTNGGAATDANRTVNVLGMTPLDFANQGSRDSIATFVRNAGFRLGAVWAQGSSLQEIAASGYAALNLVVSATGVRAAKVLRERFGTPYVIGLPTRGFVPQLAQAMEASLADGRCRNAYLELRVASGPAANGPAQTVLVGEPVQMGSLAASLATAGVAARVVSPLEDTAQLVSPTLGDAAVQGEEQVERALAGAKVVAGDPFFRMVCKGAKPRFVRLPHLALSGRQWLHEIPNLMELDLTQALEGEGHES